AARKEYEAYLAARGKTRALRAELADERALLAEVEQLLKQAEEQARREHQLVLRPPSMPPPVLPAKPIKPAAPAPRLVDDPAARRRALARKLGGRAPLPPVAPPAPPPPEPTSSERQAAAAEELKRRYEQRMLELQRAQLERYRHACREALAQGKYVSALNALRIAAGLSPGDEELARELSTLETHVAVVLSDAYLEQARYEENQGHYAEAAQS